MVFIIGEQSSCPDLMSDLPLCIIHIILSFLPIRDAIRTSILSKKWRYIWSSLPHLAFDDTCLNLHQKELIYFISQTLFLHEGPIHTFELRLSWLSIEERHCIDQWLMFLSRNDIKNLLLEIKHFEDYEYDGDEYTGLKIHSSLYSCRNFTSLKLHAYTIAPPPPSFKGFLCLKSLYLSIHKLSPTTIESILALSPLLEKLTLHRLADSKLTISAPNLKYLHLSSGYDHISLCTPLLEEFVGDFMGTEYFNIEGESVVFHHLRTINLSYVPFDNKDVTSAVIRLITGTPNLQKLEISSWIFSKGEATELAFASLWDTNLKYDCLKVIKMEGGDCLIGEMKLLKLLLARSPVLDKMIYKPQYLPVLELLKLTAQLLGYRRASTSAEIVILDARVSRLL